MPKEVLHCYLRVSTRVQETEGTSLDTQKEQGILRAKDLGFKHKYGMRGQSPRTMRILHHVQYYHPCSQR